jgi:uncharacterized SAM-binding protein YcdF (DUF218 family)
VTVEVTVDRPPDDGLPLPPPETPPQSSRWRGIAWWSVRGAAIIAALMVLYVGVTFVQVWHASRSTTARPADAIVVLGAAQYDGRPSPVLRARLDRAYDLYQQGFAPRIVTTGGNKVGDRFTEGYAGFDYLRGRGVPEANLIVINDGTNTWEELSATARVLHERGYHSVVLVSSGYHALRVAGTADDLGLDASVARTSGHATFRQLVRETAAVSVGRIIGFRRLATLG